MARASRKIGEELAQSTRATLRFQKKIDELHRAKHITTSEAERAYAGAIVEHYMLCERAVEDLFCGLLTQRLKSKINAVQPLVTVKSDSVARRIVRGERNFVDWFPWERYTLGRAEAFFSRALPFSLISKADQTHFTEYGWIRNAVAHRSSSAMRTFTKKLIIDRGIVPTVQRPGQFLRGSHTTSTTRFEYYVVRSSIIVERLSE